MNPAAGCNIKRSIRAGMAKRCKKCGNSLPQDDAELATVSNKRGKAFRIELCWWYYEDSTKEERIEYSEMVDVHKERVHLCSIGISREYDLCRRLGNLSLRKPNTDKGFYQHMREMQ